MHHLGEELPFGHRDRLRLGVTGVHQAFEHHRTVVDVVVDGQIDPAQPAVRDAALDLVLAGDDVARDAIGAGTNTDYRSTGTQPSDVPLPSRAGPADRPSAVPAEPLGFRHHRIGHQGFERIDVGHPGDLHQAAAELSDRR